MLSFSFTSFQSEVHKYVKVVCITVGVQKCALAPCNQKLGKCAVVDLGLGWHQARLKKEPSDDVIILKQP